MILLKGFVGGAFISFILWLSQTRAGAVSGLLLFFPIISVPTFFFLAKSGNAEQMRETILWSLWAVPVWILFALTLYFCSYRMRIIPSMILSLLVWCAAAGILVYFRKAS